MVALTLSLLLPSQLKPSTSSFPPQKQTSLFLYTRRSTKPKKKYQSIVPVARLFGPAIFEASKLNVLFLGVDEKKHPEKLPRTYTLTHSDVTCKLTLAISETINNSQLQGWYNRLQRDEVVAEWKKVKNKMSLHVHCHISGGHFLLNLFARLRYFIFSKELPVVLMAFVYGDGNLFNNYPDLLETMVWVYFHSNIPEFNKVECWGPLNDAAAPCDVFHGGTSHVTSSINDLDIPQPCQEYCTCCFSPMSLITWSHDPLVGDEDHNSPHQNLQATNLKRNMASVSRFGVLFMARFVRSCLLFSVLIFILVIDYGQLKK